MAPADTLVYLETNDLGAALRPIVDNKAFEQAAKKKPDLSALKGVQLAVIVTGLETKEEKLTEENSIGRVQPHFAAIADTHAWSWQTKSFAVNQLGEFINNVYDGGITLDTTPKNGGTYYVWTAEDGRKAYAVVDGSLIFFGNDESSIDKCLAVKRGEADSILKNPKLPQVDPNSLAQGYIPPDGVAQIANIAGLAMAAETGEEETVKSFIAGVLPQLLRSSISDVSWTATKTEQGIEDTYLIGTAPDVSNVLSETMAPGEGVDERLIEELPSDGSTVTLYNLKNPQVAWRSVLLVTQKQIDPGSGKILTGFSSSLFEPYGIQDPELFLASVGKIPQGQNIMTAKLDPEGEKIVTILTRGNDAQLLRSLRPGLKPPKVVIEGGINTWSTPDDTLQVIFDGDSSRIGSKENLVKCLGWSGEARGISKEPIKQLITSKAPIATVTRDSDSASQIASVLSDKKSDGARADSNYFTETRFTKNGIERKTVSDFGLIGSIIAQLAPED